jgi:hypothetical protein
MVSVRNKVDSLVQDPSINREKNDVRWFSGWSHSVHTFQYRFGAAETRKLASAIESRYTPAAQRSILKELAARSAGEKVGGASLPGNVAFESKTAADIMNELSKKVGAGVEFKASRQRPPTPMG